jgi:hypothetical protein
LGLPRSKAQLIAFCRFIAGRQLLALFKHLSHVWRGFEHRLPLMPAPEIGRGCSGERVSFPPGDHQQGMVKIKAEQRSVSVHVLSGRWGRGEERADRPE